MAYDASGFHKSERKLADEGRAVRLHAGAPRDVRRDRRRSYPPEQRKSAVLAALYLVQEQQGYLTAQRRCGTSPSCSAARRPTSRTS